MTSHSFLVSRDQQTQACTIYIHLKLNNMSVTNEQLQYDNNEKT